MTDPVEALTDRAQQLQPPLPIIVVEIDRLPAITPGRDMIQRPGERQTQWSSHELPLLFAHSDQETSMKYVVARPENHLEGPLR